MIKEAMQPSNKKQEIEEHQGDSFGQGSDMGEPFGGDQSPLNRSGDQKSFITTLIDIN